MADDRKIALLPSRGVIAIGGPDAREFLQGLITNDIEKARADHTIYAALLTPQGKLLFDFFIIEHEGGLLLECRRDLLPALLKRLTLYRLRAKVTLEDVSENWHVAAAFGNDAAGAELRGVSFTDPRLAALGKRALIPAGEEVAANARETDYETFRLALGVPDVPADTGQDQTFMLEANFDELHGVDFQKGCYIGQELASRMKRKSGLRKRLLPVIVEGPLPPPGTPVMAEERRIGEMRTGIGHRAMAYLRLDRLQEEKDKHLTADGAVLIVDWPDWIPNA